MARTATRQDNAASTCTTTTLALQFLAFMHSDAMNPSTPDISPFLGIEFFPAQTIEQTVAKLDMVTCNEQTLLITLAGKLGVRTFALTLLLLAVSSPIPQGVASAALALTVMGVLACALTVVFINIFSRRTAVRAASPYFLMGERARLPVVSS